MRIMRTFLTALLGCALAASIHTATVLGQGAIRIDEMEELVKEIEAEAEAWVTGRRPDVAMTHRLRAVWYDVESLIPLSKALDVSREPPRDLYVANRLFYPLVQARAHVISESISMVETAWRKMGKYKPYPSYSKAELRKFQMPGGDDKVARGSAEKARGEKLKAEREIQRHNEQVKILQGTMFRLMVLAGNPDHDAKLSKALVLAEEKGSWIYADVLEAIRSQAKRMKRDRAKVFYEGLRKFWDDVRAREKDKKTYVDDGAAELLPDKETHFVRREDIAKTRILTVINQVAPAARMPALRDPKTPRKPTKDPRRGRDPRRRRTR